MIKSRLRDVLEERGIKQKWLTQKTGFDKTTISRIVQGKGVPTLEVAFRIAKVLGLRVDDLWSLAEEDEE